MLGLVACAPAVTSPVDTDGAGDTSTVGTDGETVGPSTTVDPSVSDTTGDPLPPSTRAVDVLFVIDNSGTMGAEQGRLATAGAPFIAALDDVGLDWRIGFTTTDNGNPWCGSTSPEAGSLQLSSCLGRTGEFVFNGNPPTDATAEACLQVCNTDTLEILSTTTTLDPNPRPRPWLERAAGMANVEVDPAEAFACAAPQGIAGCGFEAPLESMYKAFLRAENGDEEQYGFLRDEALLVVVIVTDEADCSYNNEYQSIFLPSNEGGDPVFWSDPEASSPTSAVCWNAGVACTGAGTYDECHAENKDTNGNTGVSDDQAVMLPVARYVDYLQSLEDAKRQLDPAQEVLVAVIGGVPIGYEQGVPAVYQDSMDPQEQGDYGIGPACGSAAEPTRAVPAVREREVAEAFVTGEGRNLWSVCEPAYDGALAGVAAMIIEHVAPG